MRSGPPHGRHWRRRRARRALALVMVLVVALALTVVSLSRTPSVRLTPFEARVVSIATSQVGYQTDPRNGYCNRYSAYFDSGAAICPNGELSEEWCADFAAWVWRRAGAQFMYGYGPGQIDAAAASFYRWGLTHHRWHPASSGYLPKPGDVAVYGLDAASLVAAHVAVVVGYTPGAAGPNVVNGDGDRIGFSDVDYVADEHTAYLHGDGGQLSGYVSPILPRHPIVPRPRSGSGLPSGPGQSSGSGLPSGPGRVSTTITGS